MKNHNSIPPLVWVGSIAIWIFFSFEIITDSWLASRFPGYDWQKESLSYLGQAGSPVEHWVEIWGFLFSALLILFALGFYQTYKTFKWSRVATLLLVMYALGEGIGSGSFPINPPGTPYSTDAWYHNFFSGIGDTGIVLFPFVMMLLFPKKDNPRFRFYLWSVVLLGMTMASFFLIAKYFHPDNFILNYKGLWQRIYMNNYHLLLVVVGVRMIQVKKR